MFWRGRKADGLDELSAALADAHEQREIEEYHRLLYVAMTRAQDQLYLTNASLRRMHGSVRYNAPSRFLEEIPEELAVGDLPSRAAASRPQWYELPDRGREPAANQGVHVDYSEGQWGADEIPPIVVGSRVAHAVFGAGTVQEVAGSGESTKLRIRFDRAVVEHG